MYNNLKYKYILYIYYKIHLFGWYLLFMEREMGTWFESHGVQMQVRHTSIIKNFILLLFFFK